MCYRAVGIQRHKGSRTRYKHYKLLRYTSNPIGAITLNLAIGTN